MRLMLDVLFILAAVALGWFFCKKSAQEALMSKDSFTESLKINFFICGSIFCYSLAFLNLTLIFFIGHQELVEEIKAQLGEDRFGGFTGLMIVGLSFLVSYLLSSYYYKKSKIT